jgi:hypothetical protein
VLLFPYKTNEKVRQPGILKGQIIVQNNCWDDDEEFINKFENSALFPS